MFTKKILAIGLFYIVTNVVNAAFIVDIYNTPAFGHTDQLRNYINANDKTGSYQYDEINFSDWGNQGFFGNENEWPIDHKNTFAAHITGVFDIAEVGQYDFASWSDDGVDIFIDGMRSIFRPNPHAPTLDIASLFLTTGLHTIDVIWYENYGAAVLELATRKTGSSDWALLRAADISQASSANVVPEPTVLICMVIGLLILGRQKSSGQPS